MSAENTDCSVCPLLIHQNGIEGEIIDIRTPIYRLIYTPVDAHTILGLKQPYNSLERTDRKISLP